LSLGTKLDRKLLSLIVKTYNMPMLRCVKVSLCLSACYFQISCQKLGNRSHEFCYYLNRKMLYPKLDICKYKTVLRIKFFGLSNPVPYMNQCSGSESGSTCFWASRIRIRILLSSSKTSKKNLGSYCFVTYFGLFFF
jgi:hypothetical protein